MRLKLLSEIKSSITGFLLVLAISAGAQTNFTLTYNTEGGAGEYPGGTTITLPFQPDDRAHYDVDIDNNGLFGDNDAASLSLDDLVGTQTLTFAAPGVYTIQIRPTATATAFSFSYNWGHSSEKLVSVNNWGSMPWESLSRAFFGCFNMDLLATDTPDFSNLNGDLQLMFALSDITGDNTDFNAWDVSNVHNMSNMFLGASDFNGDISAWNVSNVNNMVSMFSDASSFNGDISAWDVSNVNSMSRMFSDASNFNGDISAWDVSNVNNMVDMLFRANMSLENYDALLNGWAELPSLQSGVIFGGRPGGWCEGGPGRDILAGPPNNWSFSGESGSRDDTNCTLSTNNFDLDSNIRIFTNSEGNLRIVGLEKGLVKVRIYNLLVEQIFETTFEGKEFNDIKLPDMKTGIYIIQLKTETGRLNKKLIIQ